MSEKTTLYALDIETTGLDYFKDSILGIGLYSPLRNFYFDTPGAFARWLAENRSARFIAHSGAFDFNFLKHNSVIADHCWDYDTRSLASLLLPATKIAEGQKRELSLENLAIVLLGYSSWKLDRENMSSYTADEVKAYCLHDCKVTYELYEYCRKKIHNWDFVEEWLMPATRFCAQLEWNGIYVDKPGLEIYQTEARKKRDEVLAKLNEATQPARSFYREQQIKDVKNIYREMYEKAKIKAKDQEKCKARYEGLEAAAIEKVEPFNWNSNLQLQWLLKDFYCLDIFSERELRDTTSEAQLRSIDHPIAKQLCDYREVEKLCSTCIPALLENISEDGLVHANYSIGGTRTGRLSSSGPNLQQIPRGHIRSYVQTSDRSRILLTIDYSQIEVRIIAELAKESELIHAFKEGIDPYSIIAQKLLKIDCDVREIKEKFKKERDVSKTAGLSILYGTGAAKLQEVLNKELNKNYSLNECRQFIKEYRDSLPGVAALRKKLDRSLANGKVCFNLLGRPFAIESNEDIYMKGLNTLVQGSASDLVIYSQTKLVIPKLQELGVNFKHRMLIHDEVVIELPSNEAELLTKEVIVPAMTTELSSLLDLSLPMTVEYTLDKSWNKP